MVTFLTGVITGAMTSDEGEGEGIGVCAAIGVAFASCVNFTFSVGDEKVNPAALKCSQPFCSFTTVVATLCWPPSDDVMLTEADIGALLNL